MGTVARKRPRKQGKPGKLLLKRRKAALGGQSGAGEGGPDGATGEGAEGRGGKAKRRARKGSRAAAGDEAGSE